MSTTLPMSKGVFNRINLLKVKFPEFEVTDDLLPFLECAELNTNGTLEDHWISVPDSELLKKVRPLMDPDFTEVFEDKVQWEEVEKDVKGGVTFAFYWNGEYLNWER